MNEYLLKAVIRLFAIVAKGNVTDESRERIKFIVYRQASSENAEEYLKIFEEFTCSVIEKQNTPSPSRKLGMDQDMEEFVEEWANIMLICKRINLESSLFQKLIVLLRVIELSHEGGEFSERQDNLIYYIGQTLNIKSKLVEQIKQFVFGEEISALSNKNVLIIDDGSRHNFLSSKHLEMPGLTGFIAVLYIPEVENYIIKYVGDAHIFLNGSTLNNKFSYIFPPGSNVRGSKLKPIYYSNVVSQFKVAQDINKIKLTADDVWVHFKQGRIGLRNIDISEESGKLIGIMGASGAGKSTLLETLNGKIKPKHGSVIINGVNIHEHPEKLEGLIGYVPQDDLLIEDLTVFENLYYAAKLCFAGYEKGELTDLVNNTLQTLGIYDTKDLTVGNPLQKTISGGQRKRLNIALELLREPAILFLDEPTSGLSSRDSENILDLLKELALKGKLVFTTIHQPSSDIFKMFDNLLLLDVGGYQIYYGDPVDAIVYFRDVVNMIQRDQGSCITCGNVSVEQIFNIIETRVVDEYGKFTNQRRISPKEWGEHFKKRLKPTIHNESAPLPPTTFKIPSKIEQFKVFCKRDILSKLKNKQYLIVNFSIAPLLGLIIGYFIRYHNPGDEYRLVGYTFSDNGNIPYYFLMSIIVALFIGLSVSGEEIIKDRRILQRERFLNLSNISYLNSKVVILFGISAIQTLSYVIVGNLLLEFQGMFFSYWFVLFTIACLGNLIGLNISSAFDSVITIYIMIPIILIPQLMFNGVAIDFDKLNPNISSSKRVPLLGEMMASRWAFEAIMVRQFKDNEFETPFYPYEKIKANSDYKTGHYLKRLETNLLEANAALRGGVEREKITEDLDLIRNELKKELSIFDATDQVDWGKLVPEKYDSATGEIVKQQIIKLNALYNNRKNTAMRKIDSIKSTMTATLELEKEYFERKSAYTNDMIISIVANQGIVLNPILEVGNTLIRKVTPIYATPEVPENPWNFRTFYYAPEKYFMGIYYDTFGFNLVILWLMCLLTLIVLYLDLLKRLIQLFSKLGDYKFRKSLKKAQLSLRK